MVDHVVLFKLKGGVTDAQIDRAILAIEGLGQRIPGILRIDAGRNFSERGGSYGFMLVSSFRTRADLDVYLRHPDHRSVVEEYILPIREEIIVGDIETSD